MTCLAFGEAVATSQPDWIESVFAAYVAQNTFRVDDDAGVGLSQDDLKSLEAFRSSLVSAKRMSLPECKRSADAALEKAAMQPEGLIQQIAQSFRLAGRFKQQWNVEEQEPGTFRCSP